MRTRPKPQRGPSALALGAEESKSQAFRPGEREALYLVPPTALSLGAAVVSVNMQVGARQRTGRGARPAQLNPPVAPRYAPPGPQQARTE